MERPADVIMKSETIRMTEENNVVVVESIVHLSKKIDGSVFATIKAIDVIEIENGKIKRIDAFTAELKNSS
jgi:hypothetical protein